MISAYRPGSSPLYRIPAGVKLTVLVITALSLSLWHPPALMMLGAALLATVLLASAVGLREALGVWWRLRWLIVVLGGALWVFADPQIAILNTARVVTLLLLADVVTRTTRMEELLDVLSRVLHPLRRFGVAPDAVALALSLTIALVPIISGYAEQVRDAHRARGHRLGLRSALPLLVMTLRHADYLGDALVARGLVR